MVEPFDKVKELDSLLVKKADFSNCRYVYHPASMPAAMARQLSYPQRKDPATRWVLMCTSLGPSGPVSAQKLLCDRLTERANPNHCPGPVRQVFSQRFYVLVSDRLDAGERFGEPKEFTVDQFGPPQSGHS